MTKPCKKCGSTERYKNGRCTPCQAEYNHLWREKNLEYQSQWRKNNPEYHIQYQRRWRENNLEKARERQRRWRKDNPEKIAEHDAQYRKRNLKKVKERIRQWKDDNPEKERANSNRRRAWKNKVVSQTYDFEAICAQYENKCLCCDRGDVDLTVDHIIPISWGGPDIADNIQPFCLSCNSGKGNHHATDYRPDKALGPLPFT